MDDDLNLAHLVICTVSAKFEFLRGSILACYDVLVQLASVSCEDRGQRFGLEREWVMLV